MPNAVNLNISDTEKLGNRWAKILATDGTPYWYKYNGGNSVGRDGDGNNRFQIPGDATTFNVTFTGNDGETYRFVAYLNKSDPTDLNGDVDENGGSIAVTDQRINEGDFDWGARIARRSNTSVTFDCDPVVTNWR